VAGHSVGVVGALGGRRRLWHGLARTASTRRRGSRTAARRAGSSEGQDRQRRADLEIRGGATGHGWTMEWEGTSGVSR
jgi:hypothetical protein